MREVLKQNAEILKAAQAGVSAVSTKEPLVEAIDDAALERMSRPELLAHLQKTNQAAIDAAISAAVKPQLEALQAGLNSTGLTQMIQRMSQEHKDFSDWLPEINDIAGKVSGLDPEGMYTLVRAHNPEKAAELDKKYSMTDSGADNSFGGLQPGGSPQRVEKTDMSETDAANTAWTEVLGGLSGGDMSKLLRTEEMI